MARTRLTLPPVRGASGAMTIALVAGSLVAALLPAAGRFLILEPEAVIPGLFVWQLLSYGFVETSPMGVIFGALIVYSIGGQLEWMWGRERLIRFALGVVAAAGLATVLLNLVLPGVVGSYAGGVLTSSLWVGYGLSVGARQSNFWGMPVTGNVLAMIGAAFVLLNAAFYGVGVVIPQLFGLLFVLLLSRGYSPMNLWTRFRSWQLERDLKKRSSRLRSVEGGSRNVGGGSDRYIH